MEIETEDHQVTIRSARQLRQDWPEAFLKMAEHGDDWLLDEDLIENQWDQDEWKWRANAMECSRTRGMIARDSSAKSFPSLDFVLE